MKALSKLVLHKCAEDKDMTTGRMRMLQEQVDMHAISARDSVGNSLKDIHERTS